VEVQNGSDLYLTLDVNIQGIVEKHLEKGVVDNKRSCGVSYTREKYLQWRLIQAII